MERPFQGQERLFEEQRKIQEVVSATVPAYMLEYAREHPAFKDYNYPDYYFDNQKNHTAFSNTEFLNGQIIYDL